MDEDLTAAAGEQRVGAGLDVDDEPLWQWVGAMCGIAAVVALVASGFMVPQPPKSNASVGRILTYYVDHRRALLFSQWLAGLGLALFLWFVGSLRGAWGRARDSAAEFSAIAFAGGVALAGGGLAALGLNLTLVYLGHDLQNSPDLVRTLYTAQSLMGTIIFFAGAVFLAGAGLLTLRRRVGAPWLGVTGVILAVFDLFAAGAISDLEGVRSPTGPLPLAAFTGLLAWVLILSVLLTSRARRARSAAVPLT
jgi:hypothetical protein